MIQKDVFLQGMGLLAGDKGRELDGAVSREWYSLLSPVLTDEQFMAAIRRCMAEERFWPSAAVILEKAGVDDATRADRAFRHMHDTLNANGGYRFMPLEKFEAFDDATKAGIKAVGGLMEISTCSEQRWPSLVKKFCKAYTEALTSNPVLSSGATVDPEVRRLVAQVGRDLALPTRDR